VLPFIEIGKNPSLCNQTEDRHNQGAISSATQKPAVPPPASFDTVKAEKAPIM